MMRVSKRYLVSPGIKRPQIVKTTQTSHKVDGPVAARSLMNGLKGQPVFPKGNVSINFKRQFSNMSAWFMTFGGMMMAWPWLAKHGSNFVHSVPGQTPAVYFDHGEAVVNTPNKVHLDKPSDE
ncbi:hypothetical protein CLIB1444_02S13322 [[Candida] jaroonii]|uniref:Uncharacterized protein n=1 Tax=[Candida] jaroonii TaxID=467808 RepID=A0ACA9Y3W3_9ASCO|nr:hypothetical protein CLIB1444_02S13322 [[Candida] jaroonii]